VSRERLGKHMSMDERVRAGISPAGEGDIWEYGTTLERAERRCLRRRRNRSLPIFLPPGCECAECQRRRAARE